MATEEANGHAKIQHNLTL